MKNILCVYNRINYDKHAIVLLDEEPTAINDTIHLILYTTYQSLLESFGIKTKELSMKFCVILVVLYGGFITNLIMDTSPITTVRALVGS